MPVDGGLAAALGVTLEMISEEAGRLAEIIAERLQSEDFADFVFDGLSRGAALFATPDDSDDLANAELDVQWMIRVINEDAIPGNADGISS